jgi:hypothetical protein
MIPVQRSTRLFLLNELTERLERLEGLSSLLLIQPENEQTRTYDGWAVVAAMIEQLADDARHVRDQFTPKEAES